MGRAVLQLAIVFAEMECDLTRERMLTGLERVKSTGKHLGRHKGISRKRAEEIQGHALAGRTLVGPQRHDNRAAVQQHPPDLYMGPRKDSAYGLRGRITGLGLGGVAMKGATGCGIKLREKLCSYVWLASLTTSWATVTPRRTAATTRRNRPGPNLPAPTWPSNSFASTCAGDTPERLASKTGCSTRPSMKNPEFSQERTAEHVRAG